MIRNADIPRPNAFTIIELLVALALTATLMFVVNSLFFSTSRAVQVGTRQGNMLVESETISDQLQRDMSRIIQPKDEAEFDSTQEAGFLVIVTRSVEGNAQRQTPVMVDTYERTEQGYFDRQRREARGQLTLEDGVGPGVDLVWPAMRSDMLMFISGDADADGYFRSNTPQQPTRLDSDLRSNHARIWYGHALRTDSAGVRDGSLGEGGGSNQRASNWMLGRHQLLLAPDGLDVATGADIHAEDASWQANVVNTDAPATPDHAAYRGLTDVTSEPLAGPDSIVEWLNDFATATYPERAEAFFLRNDGTNTLIEQMHANPSPDPMTFEAWQMAQTHPILSTHVSDFIVEFAGNYDTTPGTDRDSSNAIKWYTHESLANRPGGPNPYDERRPVTWEVPDRTASILGFTDDAGDTRGPYVMPVLDDMGEADNAHYFLFRHDKPGTWPHMLRIRYRLHDRRGVVQSRVVDQSGAVFPMAGQWFEHVIAVPQPE